VSFRFVFLAALGLMSAPVMSMEYEHFQPLLIEAIDAEDGKSYGTLIGPIADSFSEKTGSMSPVKVNITTIKTFKQEGCKRLNVRLSQANVQTKDGKSVEFDIDYGLNYCRDGTPPTEGMDLESVGKLLSKDRKNYSY